MIHSIKIIFISAAFFLLCFFSGAALACQDCADVAVAEANEANAEATANVQWLSYSEGMETLQSGENLGFLHFYTDWCGFCKKMEEETFSVKEISDYLNQNFIPIKVDAEAQKDLARQYGANQYPANIFLSPDGDVIAGRPGYVPAAQMIDILKYIHTKSFETMTFMEFMNRN